MKLAIPCMRCIFPELGGGPDRLLSVQIVDIRDDGLYEFICPNGHTSITALQEQKFEILFEIGANAILDGYYREAVSSFTSSLERFYEFYIRVVARKNGVPLEEYGKAWREIAAESNRQLGAFIYLYLVENRVAPNVMDNRRREFRNDVIHKGKIPEKSKALEYGNYVFQLIDPVLQDLKVRYETHLKKIVGEHRQSVQHASPGREPTSSMTQRMLISIAHSRSDSDPKSLEQYLPDLERQRSALQQSGPGVAPE